MQCIKPRCITDILQIKQKVLAPAHFCIHTQMVLFDQITAIQLVPEHAVIVVGRILHHMRGKLGTGQQSVLHVTLRRNAFTDNTVKIRDDEIALVFLCGLHHKLCRI